MLEFACTIKMDLLSLALPTLTSNYLLSKELTKTIIPVLESVNYAKFSLIFTLKLIMLSP
jgi:hypothetical protein